MVYPPCSIDHSPVQDFSFEFGVGELAESQDAFERITTFRIPRSPCAWRGPAPSWDWRPVMIEGLKPWEQRVLLATSSGVCDVPVIMTRCIEISALLMHATPGPPAGHCLGIRAFSARSRLVDCASNGLICCPADPAARAGGGGFLPRSLRLMRPPRGTHAEYDRDESRFPGISRRVGPLVGETGPGPAGAARLGNVRLGEFGHGDHHHHGRFSDLLWEGGLRGHGALAGDPVVQPPRPRSGWSSSR